MDSKASCSVCTPAAVFARIDQIAYWAIDYVLDTSFGILTEADVVETEDVES